MRSLEVLQDDVTAIASVVSAHGTSDVGRSEPVRVLEASRRRD